MNITQLLLDTYFGDNDSVLVLGDFCEENNVCFQGLINADVEGSLFINIYNSGFGSGYSYNYGNGNGYGYGYGNGNGDGDSFGNGYDNGYEISNNAIKEEFYL